jgi:hypothetical protein
LKENLNKKNTEGKEFRSSGVQEFRRILNLGFEVS